MIIFSGGGLLAGMKSGIHHPLLQGILFGTSILVYPFSRQRAQWKGLLQAFSSLSITKEWNIQWCEASEDRKVREEQVDNSQVIILPGGNEHLLLEHLGVDELSFLASEKQVIASSAGVNIFSERYYSNDRTQIDSGLGILPIKTLCHYEETKYSALESLQNIQPSIRTIALRELELFIYQ